MRCIVALNIVTRESRNTIDVCYKLTKQRSAAKCKHYPTNRRAYGAPLAHEVVQAVRWPACRQLLR